MPLKYPHMAREDEPVWERWLALHQAEFLTFLYDIRVGSGAELPSGGDPKYDDMWRDLTRKRIDVIARRPGLDLIIEVKKIAGWTALGQILGYPVLWSADREAINPIGTLLVCEQLMPDLETVLNAYSLPFELV